MIHAFRRCENCSNLVLFFHGFLTIQYLFYLEISRFLFFYFCKITSLVFPLIFLAKIKDITGSFLYLGKVLPKILNFRLFFDLFQFNDFCKDIVKINDYSILINIMIWISFLKILVEFERKTSIPCESRNRISRKIIRSFRY